jgi:hypothetical protein
MNVDRAPSLLRRRWELMRDSEFIKRTASGKSQGLRMVWDLACVLTVCCSGELGFSLLDATNKGESGATRSGGAAPAAGQTRGPRCLWATGPAACCGLPSLRLPAGGSIHLGPSSCQWAMRLAFARGRPAQARVLRSGPAGKRQTQDSGPRAPSESKPTDLKARPGTAIWATGGGRCQLEASAACCQVAVPGLLLSSGGHRQGACVVGCVGTLLVPQ